MLLFSGTSQPGRQYDVPVERRLQPHRHDERKTFGQHERPVSCSLAVSDQTYAFNGTW